MNFSSPSLLAGKPPQLSDLKGFSPVREEGLINPDQHAVNNGDIMQHDFFQDTVPQLIDYILQFSAGIAVLMIVVGGVMIMFSGENEDYKSRGMKTIAWAIAGLIIATLGYTLVEILNRVPITDGNPDVDLRIDEKNGVENLASGDFLTDILPKIIQMILQTIGMIALVILIYAGALMVMRDDDDERISKARNLMIYSIIGVVVSVLAYLIIEAVLQISFA